MEASFLDVHYIEWKQTIICWVIFYIWDQAKIYIEWFDEIFQWKITRIENQTIELDWQTIELNNAYKTEKINETSKSLKRFKNWLLNLVEK
jgi:hypothetical protein